LGLLRERKEKGNRKKIIGRRPIKDKEELKFENKKRVENRDPRWKIRSENTWGRTSNRRRYF